jgi:hypothetical protein
MKNLYQDLFNHPSENEFNEKVDDRENIMIYGNFDNLMEI